MTSSTAKCRCRHCDQSIEFDSQHAGETVTCPNCGMETILFIPQSGLIHSAPEKEVRKTPRRKGISAFKATLIGAAVFFILFGILAYFSNDTSDGAEPNVAKQLASAFVGLAVFGTGFILCLLFYFLPSIIARKRRKRNLTAIFVLNICAGWTFVGWVIALVWAYALDPEHP